MNYRANELKQTQLSSIYPTKGSMDLWFLYFGNLHRGPFSSQQMQQWLRQGAINPQMKIWKKGFKQWMRIEEVAELAVVSKPSFVAARPVANQKIVKARDLTRLMRFLFFSGALSILAYNFLHFQDSGFFKNLRQKFSRENHAIFPSISDKDKESVRQLMQEVWKNETRTIKFILSEDQKKIIMISNLNPQEDIYLFGESISGRVLSQNAVAFTSNSKLRKGIGVFNKFDLLKGNNLVPGYYHLKIGEKLEPSIFPIAEKGHDTVFFYGKDQDIFQKKLTEFQGNEKKLEENGHLGLIERFSTLKSLSRHTKKIFLDETKHLRRGPEIESFSKRYAEEVGVVMHGVVLDYGDLLGKTINKDEKLYQEYQYLIGAGKKLGRSVTEAIQIIRKQKKLDNSQLQRYVYSLTNKIDSIEKGLVAHINLLKGQQDSIVASGEAK